MFKRANKITALLVAAASIMSVVPAMAAERLGTKEGTIEAAIAFKDGKYIYQGYRTDDDNNSVYYNAGDKDKELDDVSDADLKARFDSSSVIVDDGDEYLVDIATGKVSDEDLASDVKSTASDKLQSKLKKTDRYGDYARIDDLTQVAANQFGDVWYQYQATTSGMATTVATASGNQYYGYADKTGKYIDAHKTANIRVFNGTKMVKIDEFDEATEGITASIIGTPVTIAQDKDNFYRVITVQFSGATVYTSKGAALAGPQQVYLQKISKAQGDKEKDAYLPKNVESYELASVATLAGEGDIDLAYSKIMNAVDSIADNNDVAYDNGSGLSDGKAFVGLRVIDGVIYYTEMDANDKVKTYKLKLNKNLKLDAVNTSGSTIKVDAYAVKKDGDKDQDTSGSSTSNGVSAVSIDIDGNVWAINEGKILKSEKAGDFKEVYTCDRSLDSLDVYDENSLVAWDSSGDVYTTVQEGKAESEAEAPVVTPAKVGWDKLADGTWNFYDATGTKVVNNWANVGGVWYFLKADGAMATGWLNQNGTWYYLNASGAMATGWLNDNGTWYYLNASGAMLANTTVDGYVLGASGAWVK